jgi:hypothetical protein
LTTTGLRGAVRRRTGFFLVVVFLLVEVLVLTGALVTEVALDVFGVDRDELVDGDEAA